MNNCYFSVAKSCLCDPMDCSKTSLSFTVSRCFLKLMSIIKSAISFNYLILCHPLLPSIFPSIRVFSNELALPTRWPKYLSFTFSISPSNEYLLAVQGTSKSSPTPQFKSISSLVLSLLYGPTLTSVLDYYKNHSFDYTDLCWQKDVFAF